MSYFNLSEEDKFREIQRRAYLKYRFRLRYGLVPEIEPERTNLEKNDWYISEKEIELELKGGYRA